MSKVQTLSATLAFLAVTVVACSSPAPGSSNQDVKSAEPKAKDGKDEKGGDRQTPAASAESCGAKEYGEECGACCWGANGEKAEADWKAFDACTCKQATAKCSPECAKSFCEASTGKESSTGSSDDACASCTIDYDACDKEAVAACDANADCKAARACDEAAKCKSKPFKDGESKDGASSNDDGSSNGE